MKQVFLRSAILAIVTFLISACRIDTPDEAFLNTNGILLTVRGVEILAYDPMTCQLAFNRQEVEFSVHNDNMSNYYVLQLNRMPEVLDQEVDGNLNWSTELQTGSRKNITLKVVKLEGDVIWLWSSRDKVAVTVKVLD